MAVRIANPGAGGGNLPVPGKPQLTGALAAALLQAGFAGSPVAGARTLLGALVARGFAAGAKGGLEQKLGQALKQFQSQNGLPATGRLDAATINALAKLGLVPRGEVTQQGQQTLGLQRSKDGFEGQAGGAKKEQATGGEAAKVAPQVAQQNAQQLLKGPKRAFDFALSKLGLGGGATAQEGGASKAPADASAPPPQALAEGPTAQGRADGTGLSRSKQSGDSKASGKDEVRAKQGVKDNLDRGAEEGDDDEGAEGGEEAAGQKGGEEGGPNEEGDWETGAEEGGEGSEHHQGTATSGDDDWKKQAGHAQTGDEEAEVGHYQIPGVGDQVQRALREIYVDITAGAAKATTYTWEVELYRPGIYGPGQKAEVVFKLRVERATAFDRVWTRAAEKLNELQLRFDNAEERVEPEDVLAAIRQARFRRD